MVTKGVQRLPSGRYRPRISVGGRGISLGTYGTEDEAAAVRAAALQRLQKPDAVLTGGMTLRQFGDSFLADRERSGYRDLKSDRNRWKRCVVNSSLADRALKGITPVDVAAWIRELSQRAPVPRGKRERGEGPSGKKVAAQTVRNARSLLSAAFQHAVVLGLVKSNPVRGAKVRDMGQSGADEPWIYYEPHEQHALMTADQIPEYERLVIAWQIGTGMRPSETASLLLEDLHLGDRPYAVVRFGKEGLPPKNGKKREVELFGIALAAVRRWTELRESVVPNNFKGLVWPRPSGCRRRDDRLIPRWHQYLKAAGVRRGRIYDLRHTCASSMIAGWWGRVWTVAEIFTALGHSSLKMTMRYAHIGASM